MDIKKVIIIEDTTEKYMSIYREIRKFGADEIFWAKNAKDGIDELERACQTDDMYDVLICDMHFDFYGEDDRKAGEKTLMRLREKGIDIPVIFFSSQNWDIPGAAGKIFYNPNRDWEYELRTLLESL